jgi:3-dehydroquinate synthase
MLVQIAPFQENFSDFVKDKTYSQVVVLTDTNTRKHCYPLIKSHLPKHKLINIAPGEAYKNLATCEKIWAEMTHLQLDRHALMINLGGGVVGDMGGFCAATYKRGIDFVQVPTTLLAQVDASVGGKLGIDFQGFKNHLGVFTMPKKVLIDPTFLQTLPYVELRSGFAEVVKHCLIADAAKWNEICLKELDQQNWPDLIAHSVAIKSKVVTQDPTEKGLRKILNFGHTIGHAVETYFLDHPKHRLLHGEAIAAGMLMETFLAYRQKMVSLETLGQVEEFIFSVFGKTALKATDTAAILQLMKQDKKNQNGQLRFALIDGLGSCQYDLAVSPSEIKRAIQYYCGE